VNLKSIRNLGSIVSLIVLLPACSHSSPNSVIQPAQAGNSLNANSTFGAATGAELEKVCSVLKSRGFLQKDLSFDITLGGELNDGKSTLATMQGSCVSGTESAAFALTTNVEQNSLPGDFQFNFSENAPDPAQPSTMDSTTSANVTYQAQGNTSNLVVSKDGLNLSFDFLGNETVTKPTVAATTTDSIQIHFELTVQLPSSIDQHDGRLAVVSQSNTTYNLSSHIAE
jgi:hypothetical protein